MGSTKRWADYCISAVRYDTRRSQVDKVIVHVDEGDAISGEYECSRSEVLKAMGLLKRFVTISGDASSGWRMCEVLRAIEVDGQKYLRSDLARTGSDYLGELPEF